MRDVSGNIHVSGKIVDNKMIKLLIAKATTNDSAVRLWLFNVFFKFGSSQLVSHICHQKTN